MPQYRKPRTKSQKQISNDLVNPYIDPETGESIGNPNEKTSFEQFTPTEQSGVEFNRSEKLSFKGDTVKPFSVGIQDIDESVFYYFENVIKPFVHQNGVRIPVPLIYGAPEKWKSVQKDGYYKDKNGKIMSPIIVFKRDNIENNRSITNKLDANTPHLYTSWQKAYNPKNSYSNFEVLNNRIPVKQFVANVVPDYITLTYSFIIQTYYVEQLNKIIEAINYSSNSYWGDPERFKFKANIGGFAITTELNQDDERVVRSTFTLTMYGYVVPDVLQKDVTAIKKYNSKSKITIGLETVDSISNPPIKPKPYSPIFIDGQILVINQTSIDPNVLIYLNTNIQKLGTYASSTTVTFNSGWLVAPSGLPTTSINNFNIFCNGALIELAAIVSFTESSGITTLIIDASQLGYSFSPTDEVVAIGKFSS
jgi:hypothetical protein